MKQTKETAINKLRKLMDYANSAGFYCDFEVEDMFKRLLLNSIHEAYKDGRDNYLEVQKINKKPTEEKGRTIHKWSRIGRCPYCLVGTGSYHSLDCTWYDENEKYLKGHK